jgi:hypothetical protein
LVYEGVPIFRRWPLPFLEHCNHAAVQGRGLVHVLGKLEGGICDCLKEGNSKWETYLQIFERGSL